MQIPGHTFLVTGGGSGLGAATAEQLIEAGANVVIAEVNAAAGTERATALGERAHFVETDVTEEDSVRAALDAARERFGALHGVVNCAGIVLARRTLGKDGPHDLESFARVVRINLLGTFNVIRLAAVVMAENTPSEEGERGVVVNTASVAAFDGQIGQVAYAASKGGVVGMTLPLARDLARHGIRVMTIAPGVFETPMVAGMPEEVKASLSQQVPFPPRLGRPAEYAFLVRHIIENVMLNGEVIRLDGAIRMAPR
ncbi:3-hydroxyacyl-CoA dehydrogenase [Rhodocaloribacter litoris]|uniref:3-hydroxyacyl-CoA dehydrogenase n=1 Tax=Rhodocaloribacter litoris TaxID=2558931 RepID=UPI001420093E|nr:3-hydroxyacyl-CoA dehydrogenase [Rhodocaloribacter litoris]QXD14593.1 3-hydroxyacyl-CoA dehydrogenase [Rhodocaloribacter litoris]GIV59637.1 MAG: 3-hydroxyacyl-CoA dehydrogenase [Rhodothermaceae bacterium]